MEETVSKAYTLLGAGTFLRYIGIGLGVIGLVLLIIFLVKKKKVTAPVILLVLAVAGFVGGTLLFNKGVELYQSASEEYTKSLVASKASYAKTDDQGNIYFQLGTFSAVDDKGNVVDNDTIKQYKYTIINLWEPWCSHCKAEFPDLEKVYEDYHDKGVNVIGVYNEQEDAADVIAEYGLTFPTVHMEKEQYQEFTGMFYVGGVPVSILVDSEGKLINVGQDLSMFGSALDGVTDPATLQLYESIAYSEKTYDFWSELLDGLLAK